jgi:deoxyribonuclease V
VLHRIILNSTTSLVIQLTSMQRQTVMHRWDVTPTEAVQIQKELRGQVRLTPLQHPPVLLGGADVSMNRFATEGFAGFVVLKNLALIDHAVVVRPIPFPYIPGLLSFREIPMLVDAWDRLKQKPDVIVVDGIGIAHPRRLGIASHLGLILNVSTIGCAKSILTGIVDDPPNVRGAYTYLHDRKTNEIIGAALRTKVNVKPVYVSPGHLITLEESVQIVMQSVTTYRLPEPTRLAHNTVNAYRKGDLVY